MLVLFCIKTAYNALKAGPKIVCCLTSDTLKFITTLWRLGLRPRPRLQNSYRLKLDEFEFLNNFLAESGEAEQTCIMKIN